MCYVKTASQGHYHPPCPAFRMSLGSMLFDACYVLFSTATFTLVHLHTHVESRVHIRTYTELPSNDKHTRTVYALVYARVPVSVAFSWCVFLNKCCHCSCQRDNKHSKCVCFCVHTSVTHVHWFLSVCSTVKNPCFHCLSPKNTLTFF